MPSVGAAAYPYPTRHLCMQVQARLFRGSGSPLPRKAIQVDTDLKVHEHLCCQCTGKAGYHSATAAGFVLISSR